MKTIITLLLAIAFAPLAFADDVSYSKVSKVLTKYCAGCHNADEANGDFALHTFESLSKGGENGNALTPGSSASSRIAQMTLGKLEPVMPPEDEAQPTDDEIQLIVDWIDAGAKGPKGTESVPTTIDAPKISSSAKQLPVTALAFSNDEQLLATARFQSISIEEIASKDNGVSITPAEKKVIATIEELPGKVTSLKFIDDGKQLIAGTGIAGLYGQAILIDVASAKIIRRFRGHTDMVYSVAVSADESWMATGSYDRKAVLWKLESEKPVREFVGHNDAIFDCQFDLTGELLLTASADTTVKVWRVSDGTRLDTRGEPLKEQYTVALSKDGKSFFAGGEDNRIRKWKLVSRAPNQMNPLEVARFGHESAIQLIRIHPSGENLITVSDDGSIKIWDIESMTEVFKYPKQQDSVQAIAVSSRQIMVGRMDGTTDQLDWPPEKVIGKQVRQLAKTIDALADSDAVPEMAAANIPKDAIAEKENNDLPSEAMNVNLPLKLSGKISGSEPTDVDHFRFFASKGDSLVVRVTAQSKSPLDSHVSILDADGDPVPKVLLQAVRDSYFTFRGKNSDQTNDFRIHNWEEMNLNQLLYCNGEVVRLYQYPRGPDSGFNVFPDFGKRHGMFDTTPITHALQEPCYIVEAFPPGTNLPANGLPQFVLNYENDDDAQRRLGKNSQLMFVAPKDGEYIVRVRDSRDWKGDDYGYELLVKPPTPSFSIKKISGKNPTLIRGAYKNLSLIVDRHEGFEGPISIEIDDLPNGIIFNGPQTIEAGNLRTFFTLHVHPDAPVPPEDAMSATITASAKIGGQTVRKTESLGVIKINEDPKLTVDLKHSDDNMPHFDQSKLPVFEIRPGETITAKVAVNRRGYKERVNFGKESAALNLPFGVYVDNTGLNGVLITPKENERTFFLTAEPWVKPCERLIFLEAAEAGKPSSNPALLRVIAK